MIVLDDLHECLQVLFPCFHNGFVIGYLVAVCYVLHRLMEGSSFLSGAKSLFVVKEL